MEEKKVEEILQDEEIPVTEEASGEGGDRSGTGC